MAHEDSVTRGSGRPARFRNIGKGGQTLGGRDFHNLEDALIEAQSRSKMSHSFPPRNPAARKNPRDPNKPRRPMLDRKEVILDAIFGRGS